MTKLPKSHGYEVAEQNFSAALDDVADAVGAVSSERVRGIIDHYKAANLALMDALRHQVIDDMTAIAMALGLHEQEQDTRLDVLDSITLGTPPPAPAQRQRERGAGVQPPGWSDENDPTGRS